MSEGASREEAGGSQEPGIRKDDREKFYGGGYAQERDALKLNQGGY